MSGTGIPVMYVATGQAFAGLVHDHRGWRCERALDDRRIQCLAVDPSDPRTVYAGSRGQGIWRSRDAGREWERLDFPETDVFSLAVSPADGALYAGCEPSRLYRSRDAGASWAELESLREIPSAPTWSFPPRPWTSHVRTIAPSPHEPDRLLVGIELGGVMLSEDGGATWLDHRPGAQRDAHALAWHPRAEGRAYEAGGGGAAWSRDGGRTWSAADRGREWHYVWGLAIDPEEPELWYVSAASNARAAHAPSGRARARIYRWHRDGPWEPIMAGLPADPLDSLPYALTATRERLWAGLGDGRIYTSDDHGSRWVALATTGEPIAEVQALIPATV